MKKYYKPIILLVVLLSTFTTSCDKFSGDTDSINGAWRCREESGLNGFRQYSVSISNAGAGFDSTYYVIYNFHNLGNEVETYVQLIDTVVTITNMGENFISGKGAVSRDFKSIEWEYTISSDFVTAYYYRK